MLAACTGGVAGHIEICVDEELRAVCDDQWWGPNSVSSVRIQYTR